MFWDFLKIWEYKELRFWIVLGLITIGVGIIGIIIVQSGEQSTPTRVYELPEKTRTPPDMKVPNTRSVDTESASTRGAPTPTKNNAGDFGNDVSSLRNFPEDTETATNNMDSPAQRGWGHYDPPPPDPEQERIWRLEERVQELQKQIEELSPQVAKDIKLLPRLNELTGEQLRIQQDLGRLHIEGIDPFIPIEIENFMATSMTEQGLPVSVGSRLAELIEKTGDVEGAEKIRKATQKAVENGDEFYRPEHVDTSEEY